MNRQQFSEWLGLDDADDETVRHRRQHVAQAGYSDEEFSGLYEFWTGCTTLLDAPRETILERWRHYLPGRGDQAFADLMQAFWDDGLRGAFFAEMLGREPEEPAE